MDEIAGELLGDCKSDDIRDAVYGICLAYLVLKNSRLVDDNSSLFKYLRMAWREMVYVMGGRIPLIANLCSSTKTVRTKNKRRRKILGGKLIKGDERIGNEQ